MRKIKVVIILSIAFILLLIFSIQKFQNKKLEPEYILIYAENQPEDYPTTLGGYKFAELVEQRTNGKIKIVIQADGILGDEKSVVKQIQYGGIDFSRVSLSTLTGEMPQLNVLQMPYLYNDAEHMWKILEGDIGDDFLNSFEEYDMVALSWYDAGARNFYNSKIPITCLEDMKGLKIRVQQSDLMIKMVEALGAIAVTSTYSEVYSYIEKDVADGAENNWPSYETRSHYEVAKYFTIDEHTRVPEVQLCAKTTWDKLSIEERKIISECAKESALYERELWVEREKQSENIVSEKGVEIIVLSIEEKEKFREAVTGVYQEFCAEYMDVIEEIINADK